MKPLGDALYHLRLLGRMGRACDVDMAEAFARGKIQSSDWAEMITRCRACPCVSDCEIVLSTREPQEQAPGFCENRETLAGLREDLKSA